MISFRLLCRAVLFLSIITDFFFYDHCLIPCLDNHNENDIMMEESDGHPSAQHNGTVITQKEVPNAATFAEPDGLFCRGT